MLIHCHKKLDADTLAELLCLCDDAATIVFRERGVLNILENSADYEKKIFYLKDDYDAHKTELTQQQTQCNRHLISGEEFVELCFNADKLIPWK